MYGSRACHEEDRELTGPRCGGGRKAEEGVAEADRVIRSLCVISMAQSQSLSHTLTMSFISRGSCTNNIRWPWPFQRETKGRFCEQFNGPLETRGMRDNEMSEGARMALKC